MLANLPIRTRLTLVFAGLLALVMAVSGILLVLGFRLYLDVAIDAEVTALAKEYASDIDAGETNVLHDFATVEAPGFFAAVLDVGGNIAEVTPGFDTKALSTFPRVTTEGTAVADVRLEGSGIGHARIGWAAAANGMWVSVGQPLEERDGTLAVFRTLLVSVDTVVLGIAAWLVWMMSGAALTPVERLRSEASLISDSMARRRLTVPGSQDEIARLAGTLNDMLDRLEAGVARERRLIDDASHELRTPLSILRTELDLALRRSRTKEELIKSIRSAAAISDELNSLAEDILVVARANGGQLPLDPVPTDLGALIVEVAAAYAEQASAQPVELTTDLPAVPLVASLDRARMGQVLRNLLDNALAYSPASGRVSISAAAEAGGARISVTDTGPGFDNAMLDHAFEPYARSDSGRSRRPGGAGLGLTIVRSIVLAHGGEVSLANLPSGGAIVTIRLHARQ